MNAREEWLTARKAGLGGSDIGAILGLSPYRTPVDVWMEKTGRSDGNADSLQMRFGTYAEEFVAQEYSRETGNAVQRFTKMLHHPTAPILGNIDRLVVPEGQKVASHKSEIRTDCLLECKTASAFATTKSSEWGEAGTDQVPMSYLVQVATYRILTGCRYADLAVLFGNQDFRIYHLWQDADLEEMIVARATEWWNRHIVGDVAPEPVCEADVKTLYPRSTPEKIVEASTEVLVALNDLRVAKAEVEKWEARAEASQLTVKRAIADAEVLIFGGKTLATYKSAKPSQRTDWKALVAEINPAPELISRFTTETNGARRFLIKD